jgi:aldehyde dehydrogenase (NAD+)
VLGVIERARAERAGRLALGGARGSGACGDGYFIEPTVFVDVDPASDLARNEVFGPVLSVIKFETEEDAVRIANATEYALSAYIQSQDFRRVRRVARDLKCGTIGVNTGACTTHLAPFGGLGLSGFGKEGGKAGLEEFVHQKTLLIR